MDMTEPVIAETVTQIDIDQRVYDLYDEAPRPRRPPFRASRRR
jgi:hypothetical protein